MLDLLLKDNGIDSFLKDAESDAFLLASDDWMGDLDAAFEGEEGGGGKYKTSSQSQGPPQSSRNTSSPPLQRFENSEEKSMQQVFVKDSQGKIRKQMSIDLNLVPGVIIEKKSEILKSATARFFDFRNENLSKLIKILVVHKKFRGNVFNLLASYLNIFNSKEPLHTFHTNIFRLKIEEIMFNKILTKEQFCHFLQNSFKIAFIEKDFRALLYKLNDLFDKEVLKVSCQFKVGVELNIIFWMIKHYDLSEHLFILCDLLQNQSLSFDILAAKQSEASKKKKL